MSLVPRWTSEDDDPYNRTTKKRDPQILDEEMNRPDEDLAEQEHAEKWLAYVDEAERRWPDS
jgi:hypothetical protein